ncbi:hypothetical protein HNP37_003756 [Flavobacterium nitrogenifigens]|uniref:Nucleotide-diphospho-sugar transferase n=2 Tax=Flavobacterium TaxID=237 RepID=A0A7W7IZZ1_9FLAO|nr:MULTISPECIES: nucleotide-diphospho-sugar transferase [Flavobacterium]MBB4803681.1 hypothetical protein [Flavobacterium nitrogenifigens]MBB6388514.1 hypothetical protein [Flavobacterium notoginsengisoli]
MEEISTFKPTQDLKTPVLFLVFNRLDTTIQVFESIRQAKPPKLYIAADGARESVKDETDKVNQVRDYVTANIDWDCEVKTLFREKNLGCKIAVSSAIDWFFENEEMGIIVEDDCLPTLSFFWFCEKMLNEHRNDERIMMISGTNYFLDIRDTINNDYFYSRHFTIWGWATWRRAWGKYDVKMQTWRKEVQPEDLKFVSDRMYVVKHFEKMFDLIYNNTLNTWDIQWVYTCLFNYGLCLTPSINMIHNIGVDGTHTTGDVTDSHFLKSHDFDSVDEIKTNPFIFPNEYYDARLHFEKSLPSYKDQKLRDVLKKMHLFKTAKYVKNIISK